MTKKEPSAKQLAARKAAGERLRAMHAAKAVAKKAAKEVNEFDMESITEAPELNKIPDEPTEEPVPMPEPLPAAVPPTVTLSQEQFQMMLDRLSNREGTEAPGPQAMQQAFPAGQPTLNSQGGVTGIIERFPINPSHYKNPTEDLYEVPELRRFGLRENFVIDWRVTPTKYQTAMGTWYIEPRFELTLKKKQFDEDNNEIVKHDDKGKAYHPRIVLGRASFFEDPPANILEAELAGLSIDDLDSEVFQDKMRMYRYKFWLMERLSPKKPVFTTSNRREEVIGGKVYEIDEYSQPV